MRNVNGREWLIVIELQDFTVGNVRVGVVVGERRRCGSIVCRTNINPACQRSAEPENIKRINLSVRMLGRRDDDGLAVWADSVAGRRPTVGLGSGCLGAATDAVVVV